MHSSKFIAVICIFIIPNNPSGRHFTILQESSINTRISTWVRFLICSVLTKTILKCLPSGVTHTGLLIGYSYKIVRVLWGGCVSILYTILRVPISYYVSVSTVQYNPRTIQILSCNLFQSGVYFYNKIGFDPYSFNSLRTWEESTIHRLDFMMK